MENSGIDKYYTYFHMKNTKISNKGKIGEEIVANFFDSHFSKFFSFYDPKTKSNAQVADVIVWFNRVVFLIEVKTRGKGSASIDSWTKSKIKEATKQLKNNFYRIKNNEVINLHNSFYQTQLDCLGIHNIIGLVILVYDEKCNISPSTAVPEINNLEFPIHVISWNNIISIIEEINTVPDLFYYLSDRFNYLKIADIQLGTELNVLGYYKTNSNKFPDKFTDFSSSFYWDNYKSLMSEHIKKRNEHNQFSGWIDALEENFSSQRKLLDGYPIGLYFAWEIGSISRRERAYIGEKLENVQSWFNEGNLTREFAFYNASTGNWIVFYYSRSEPAELEKELRSLVEYKLMIEIEDEAFEYGVYGFGFQVSKNNPPELLGLEGAIVICADYIKNKYKKTDLIEARKHFGGKQKTVINEFPDN